MGKHTIIFTLVALVLGSSLALAEECDMLLIKKGTPYYDKKGNRIGVFENGDYAFPTEERNSSVEFQLTMNDGCGCFSDESERRNNLVKIRTTINDSWDECFVASTSFTVYQYKPKTKIEYVDTYGKGPGPNPVTVLDAENAISQVANKISKESFKKPENIKNSFEFSASFEDLWASVVETIAELQLPIATIDGASGIIATDYSKDPSIQTMACPSVLDDDHVVKFSIFVKKIANGSKMIINPQFKAIKSMAEITNCYSNGKLEELIRSTVQKNLSSE
jgi:hypothetical protein